MVIFKEFYSKSQYRHPRKVTISGSIFIAVPKRKILGPAKHCNGEHIKRELLIWGVEEVGSLTA